jgi:hypothetical protein
MAKDPTTIVGDALNIHPDLESSIGDDIRVRIKIEDESVTIAVKGNAGHAINDFNFRGTTWISRIPTDL